MLLLDICSTVRLIELFDRAVRIRLTDFNAHAIAGDNMVVRALLIGPIALKLPSTHGMMMSPHTVEIQVRTTVKHTEIMKFKDVCGDFHHIMHEQR